MSWRPQMLAETHLILLRQKPYVSRASAARPGTQGQTRELDSLSPLGPGSRSGYAFASAGTRNVCDAVQLTHPTSPGSYSITSFASA